MFNFCISCFSGDAQTDLDPNRGNLKFLNLLQIYCDCTHHSPIASSGHNLNFLKTKTSKITPSSSFFPL